MSLATSSHIAASALSHLLYQLFAQKWNLIPRRRRLARRAGVPGVGHYDDGRVEDASMFRRTLLSVALTSEQRLR
jgi:hypothetical protein